MVAAASIIYISSSERTPAILPLSFTPINSLPPSVLANAERLRAILRASEISNLKSWWQCSPSQAQKEVDDLHERTAEGIETARREGKQIGQKPGAKLTTKKSIEKKVEILKHSKDFEGTLNDIDCMKLTGLSRNTFYKYKRELKAEQ